MAGDSLYNSVVALVTMTGADASTTFTDTSLSAKTYTAIGGAQIDTATADPFGASTGVGIFDGTADMVTAATFTAFGTGAFCIEGWVRPTVTETRGFIQLSTTAGGLNTSLVNTLAIGFSGSNWAIYAGDSTPTSAATYVANTWYAFRLERVGTTTKLYIDGASVISLTDSKNYTGTFYLVLGGFYSTAYLLKGALSNVRITSTSRDGGAYTPSVIPFVAGLGQLSGKITESTLTTDWRVSAHLCSNGSLVKTGIFTGDTYALDIPTLAPHNRTIEQKIDYNWSANKVSVIGDFMVPSNPETTPYLFKVTTGGDFGATEPTYDTTPGNTTAAGAATLTCIGPLVDPVTNGPKIPT